MSGLSCGMRDHCCRVRDLLVVAFGIFSCSMRTLSCGMWDLVPKPGIEPGPPALGARSLRHWTTREVPTPFFLYFQSSMICSHTQVYWICLHKSNPSLWNLMNTLLFITHLTLNFLFPLDTLFWAFVTLLFPVVFLFFRILLSHRELPFFLFLKSSCFLVFQPFFISSIQSLLVYRNSLKPTFQLHFPPNLSMSLIHLY